MELILGSWFFRRSRSVVEWAKCPHCNKPNRILHSFSGYEFLHVFFVPIFPSGHVRVRRLCDKCYGLDNYPDPSTALTQTLDDARQKAFASLQGNPDEVVANVHELALLGEFETIDQLLLKLDAGGLAWLAATCRGWFNELQQFPDQAEEQYQRAIQLADAEPTTHFWYGRFLLYEGCDEEAVAQFQTLDGHQPPYPCLELLNEMIAPRVSQKHWHGLVVLMEEILRTNPDALNDLDFKKRYAKACRKTGKTMRS